MAGVFTVSLAWHHIVLAVKNQAITGKVKICLDGVCNERALGPNSAAAGVTNFIVGQAHVGDTDAIDAMGLWSRYLSDENISELYNSGAGKQYPF